MFNGNETSGEDGYCKNWGKVKAILARNVPRVRIFWADHPIRTRMALVRTSRTQALTG
jgi:hypothetical protein